MNEFLFTSRLFYPKFLIVKIESDHHKMPLVPMYNAREWNLIAELFPGKAIATGAKSDTLGSVTYTKH
jgi:hypothetical protein